MDKVTQNGISGSFTFTGLILWVLGVWGTMRDAQDIAQTLGGVSVELLFLFAFVAGLFLFGYGLTTFIQNNWNAFQDWNYERKSKPITTFTTDAVRAVNYIAFNSNLVPSFKGLSAPDEAFKVFEKAIRNGELRVAGLKGTQVQQISSRELKSLSINANITNVFTGRTVRKSVSLNASQEGKTIFNALYIDPDEVRRLWPTTWGHSELD